MILSNMYGYPVKHVLLSMYNAVSFIQDMYIYTNHSHLIFVTMCADFNV